MEIPRALSTDEASPHYRPDVFFIGNRIDIMLDGEVCNEVTAYDMDAGIVVRAKLNADGDIFLNEAGDGVAEETLHGVVTVTVREVPHDGVIGS